MSTKTELRARIITARRAHDAAIRALDDRWRALLARLAQSPRHAHEGILRAAERDLAPLLDVPPPEAGA